MCWKMERKKNKPFIITREIHIPMNLYKSTFERKNEFIYPMVQEKFSFSWVSLTKYRIRHNRIQFLFFLWSPPVSSHGKMLHDRNTVAILHPSNSLLWSNMNIPEQFCLFAVRTAFAPFPLRDGAKFKGSVGNVNDPSVIRVVCNAAVY